jgi:hypothetical protein
MLPSCPSLGSNYFPLLQLLGDDINADLIVLKAGHGQKHRPLTQEWNKLLEHGMGFSGYEGEGGVEMARSWDVGDATRFRSLSGAAQRGTGSNHCDLPQAGAQQAEWFLPLL